MYISRIQAYAQTFEDRKHKQRVDRKQDRGQHKRARFAGYSDAFRGSIKPQSSRSSVPPVASAPPQFQRPRYDRFTYSGSGQSSRASGSQYHRDTSQARSPTPRCDQCGKSHFGLCRRGSDTCYSCGQLGHMMRHYPNRGGGGMAQLTGSVSGSSSSVQPPAWDFQQLTGRGRGRGAVPSSSGTQNRTYALVGRQDLESFPDVATGILAVFSYDVYALIDPGSTLSYVTPFVANKFDIELELVSKPLTVSTPIGDSVIARRVYRGCTVMISSRQTSANLFKLEMVDFDVIMGMD
ncbi:uncharacterized protein [Nicotiana tomentosiformis]|uniref:uncharacterized protein n=1 Tax=Nicotiana tomentosiformis TaxID=4098 RepID=UPI00388C4DC3